MYENVLARFPCYDENGCTYDEEFFQGIIQSALFEKGGEKGHNIYFSDGPGYEKGTRFVKIDKIKIFWWLKITKINK